MRLSSGQGGTMRLASASSFFTRPACRQICAAMSLCGSPAAEKSGIFWPRAMEFMVSMVEMPVWIISSGYVRSAGLMDAPLMSRNVSASTGGLRGGEHGDQSDMSTCINAYMPYMPLCSGHTHLLQVFC